MLAQDAASLAAPEPLHFIDALVYITSTHHFIPIEASEGADPSWKTFLRAPDELPARGGLWLMGAAWAPVAGRYTLMGWSRPSLMDLALIEQGKWKPPALQPLANPERYVAQLETP